MKDLKELERAVRLYAKVAAADMFKLRHLAAEVFETHALELHDDVVPKMVELSKATATASRSYESYLAKCREHIEELRAQQEGSMTFSLAAGEEKK